jgi:uncharacterized protein involved in exopolysaccharide biosynthesis
MMSSTIDTAFDFAAWFRILRAYRWRWLIPASAIALLAIAYALLRQDTWEAAQALVVRSEAGTADEPPGKFRQTEDMKVTQETVLEIARSRSVLSAALAEVGPPAGAAALAEFPTAKNIAALRKRVSLAAPKGAEFGTTEIFYLNVQDHDPQRAVALNLAISRHLQAQFQRLLDQKAKSMTVELERAARLNRTELAESTRKLGELETLVGSDLADLRSISNLSAGDGKLQQSLAQLETELRAAEVAEQSNRELLAMLLLAEHDPSKLLATPKTLLAKLPALARLKEGLVDAQLRTAQLLAAMTEAHPNVQDAIANEREVDEHIRRELRVAIRAIEVDQQLANVAVDSLRRRMVDVRARSERLSAVRAEHAQLAAQVDRHLKQVDQAESRLAETRSAEAGARAANLISLVDLPDTGTRPLGPSKAVICGTGLIGGLLTGLGILFLTVPSGGVTSPEKAISPDKRATDLGSAANAPALHKPSRANCPAAAPTNAPCFQQPCRKKLTLTEALSKVAANAPSRA